jgi:hypothetical protein
MAENNTITGEVIIVKGVVMRGKDYVVKGVRSGGPPDHTRPPHRSVGFVFPPNDPNGQHEKDLDKAAGSKPPKDVKVDYHRDANKDLIIDKVTISP